MPLPPTRHALAISMVAVVAIASCGDDDAAEPATTEPVTTEPATAEPAATAPVTTEPATTEPATTEPTTEVSEQRFPDVVGATATMAEGEWRFDVTISSPYDTPQRYADAWRILDPDGTELGVRLLAHDHQNEQPFTRSLSGVEIPDEVDSVTIEGRDQEYGWGGEVFVLTLDR